MTDHRGSKQGLWDEEVDGERPTNPGLEDTPTSPAIDLRASATAEELPTDTELEHAIELLRVSIPPVEEPASTAAAPTGTMSPEAIDSVARFISDPGLVAQNTNRDLDAPGRTLAALELLDAPEYGAEPTDMRAPPQPPPAPGVRPTHDEDLPSIVLGSQVSTRADQTERTRAIPATHPLANSIAPGGSAVSTPPRPRKSSRWQITLGAAALLAIAFGSVYLQTRGEHHAASGLPRDAQDEEPVVARREEPKPTEQDMIARQIAEAEAARALELEQAEAARQAAEAQRLADRLAEEEKARAQREAQERSAKAESTAQKAKSMRIAMGGARLIDRAEADAPAEAGPDRAQVVAAMNAMTERLKDCVGEEHGVADVTLTVRAPGVVSHALVEGAFADSPQGTCIARALRTAKMPAFADPVTRIEYPFQL